LLESQNYNVSRYAQLGREKSRGRQAKPFAQRAAQDLLSQRLTGLGHEALSALVGKSTIHGTALAF